MEIDWKKKFIDALLDYDKKFAKIQERNATYKSKQNQAWEMAESTLDKIQGPYRTFSYNEYKMYSENFIPIGSRKFDELINGMTDKERTVLGH